MCLLLGGKWNLSAFFIVVAVFFCFGDSDINNNNNNNNDILMLKESLIQKKTKFLDVHTRRSASTGLRSSFWSMS